MKRRSFLLATTVAAPPFLATSTLPDKRLGLSLSTYGIRWSARGKPAAAGWQTALDVLEKARELGAGCLQIGVGGWQEDFAGQMRQRREDYGILLEGQIALPKNEGDLDRFRSEVSRAKEAGASILRAVCLGGRRYETFPTLAAWKEFHHRSLQRLAWAEPILRTTSSILAVENHKDWRTEELLSILEHFSSEHIRVNFDFGNNLSLLEDPYRLAEALAPWIVTTHLKDMAALPYPDGFLLAEVPLGQGILDLPRLRRICESHHPATQFNLEMITRDPLKIPCFLPSYWTTLPQVPGRDLAHTLDLLRTRTRALQHVEHLDPTAQVEAEESNNRASFAYARRELAL